MERHGSGGDLARLADHSGATYHRGNTPPRCAITRAREEITKDPQHSQVSEADLPESHNDKSALPLWWAAVTQPLDYKDPRRFSDRAREAVDIELVALRARPTWDKDSPMERADAKAQFPDAHFAKIFGHVGFKNFESADVVITWICIRDSWAHGVVVSHPLRMRKALGSNPSGSKLLACHPARSSWTACADSKQRFSEWGRRCVVLDAASC